MVLPLLLLDGCAENQVAIPNTIIPTVPDHTDVPAITTCPINEESSRAASVLLHFYQDGKETEEGATLYVGEGYSIYIFDEGWELQSSTIGNLTADIWQNTVCEDVKLCAVKLDTTDFSDAHAWVRELFPEYDFLEDSQGGLGGSNTDEHMLDVWLYPTEDDMYALLQMYPLESAETFGTCLCVMADTFELG